MNCILDYVLNDNTDEECSGSDLDGEREDSDIDYESDVEIQPMFAQPVQEIIDNHLTLDDNDIYTTGIDKQQVEIARERNPVASNGSGDTPTHPDEVSNIKRDNNDVADIHQALVPTRARRGRVRTLAGARVCGFTKAHQGVGSNRVYVCGGRQGHTGQCNARQGNGNGKADDQKWESRDIGDHIDLENFVFAKNEGLKVRIKDNPQPDFVELYLTETVVVVTVREANGYVESFMEEFPEKADNSFKGQRVPVTTKGKKKFLGLLLLTGTVRKFNLKMYWLTEQLLSTPVFSKIMKCDIFLLILKFLHFNNNDDPSFDLNDENRLVP